MSSFRPFPIAPHCDSRTADMVEAIMFIGGTSAHCEMLIGAALQNVQLTIHNIVKHEDFSTLSPSIRQKTTFM
jgi:hypothetical protein